MLSIKLVKVLAFASICRYSETYSNIINDASVLSEIHSKIHILKRRNTEWTISNNTVIQPASTEKSHQILPVTESIKQILPATETPNPVPIHLTKENPILNEFKNRDAEVPVFHDDHPHLLSRRSINSTDTTKQNKTQTTENTNVDKLNLELNIKYLGRDDNITDATPREKSYNRVYEIQPRSRFNRKEPEEVTESFRDIVKVF